MSDLPDNPPQETAEILQTKSRGKPFVKGYDPRRNLKGVPADAIAGRKAIRRLGAELVHVKEKVWSDEYKTYVDVEYDITRWEAMIRLMFSSRYPRDREILLKAGIPGLLRDEVDMTSGGEKLDAPKIIEIIKTVEKESSE